MFGIKTRIARSADLTSGLTQSYHGISCCILYGLRIVKWLQTGKRLETRKLMLAFHQVANPSNYLSFLRQPFSNTERVNNVIAFEPDRALYPNKETTNVGEWSRLPFDGAVKNFYPAVIVKRPRLTICDPSAA